MFRRSHLQSMFVSIVEMQRLLFEALLLEESTLTSQLKHQ